MSPKSKGRPKGRGRAKPKSQRRPVHLHQDVADQILRIAQQIGPNVDALEVERSASTWVASRIDAGEIAQRAERTLITELGERLTRGAGSAAYTALSALRLVVTDAERATIDELLAQAPGEHPDLLWALAERPEPKHAWLISDPWGRQQVHVVGYDDPEPHQLAVVISTVGGLAAWGISVEEPDGPKPWEDVIEHPAQAVEPADSLSTIWDAVLRTDMYYPPIWEEEGLQMRALARGRSEAYKSMDWEGIDDDERALLIDEFQARSAFDAADDVVAMLADTFIDYGDGYLVGGVLAWKPGEPQIFLTDWVHRKVLLPDDAMEILPDVLKGWIEFCLGRKGLEPADIATVVDEVDEFRAEYDRLRSDHSARSPQQQLLRYLADNDIELDDKDAVAEAISVVNATRLAEQAAEAGGSVDHD